MVYLDLLVELVPLVRGCKQGSVYKGKTTEWHDGPGTGPTPLASALLILSSLAGLEEYMPLNIVTTCCKHGHRNTVTSLSPLLATVLLAVLPSPVAMYSN